MYSANTALLFNQEVLKFTKKKYHKFSPKQLQVLENTYYSNSWPNSSMIAKLSEEFNATTTKIQRWFINKRYGEKKLSKLGSLYSTL